MPVSKYRKRPVVVEALEYTGTNYDEIKEFVVERDTKDTNFIIKTTDKEFPLYDVYVWNGIEYLLVPIKHFILKDERNTYYPCDPGVFWATYDKEPDETTTEEVTFKEVTNL